MWISYHLRLRKSLQLTVLTLPFVLLNIAFLLKVWVLAELDQSISDAVSVLVVKGLVSVEPEDQVD